MHLSFPLVRSLTPTFADDLEQVLLAVEVKPEKQFVFVTDCELALMSAIASIFPNAANLLCIWHINKNILAQPNRHLDRILRINGETL